MSLMFLKQKTVIAADCTILTIMSKCSIRVSGLVYIEETPDLIIVSSEYERIAIDKETVIAVCYKITDASTVANDIPKASAKRSPKVRCPNCLKDISEKPPVRDWTCSCGCRMIFPCLKKKGDGEN